jgi:hypothetical protein
VTWQATLLGGPEDRHVFTGAGDEPPPTVAVYVLRPLSPREFADAEGPTVTSAPFDTVVCPRTRSGDGRWLFVWPTP